MTDAQAALAQIREALEAYPSQGEWYANGTVVYLIHSGQFDLCDCLQPYANAAYIAKCNPENIAAILAHVDAQAAENEQLREMLARLYAGSDLYCDDGELQDARAEPFIDFKRDSVADIRCAMVERNERKEQR